MLRPACLGLFWDKKFFGEIVRRSGAAAQTLRGHAMLIHKFCDEEFCDKNFTGMDCTQFCRADW
jgi:hypothetical protein